jgi:hypothetical protein
MTYKYWISGDDVAIFRVGDVPEVWPFHSKVLNIQWYFDNVEESCMFQKIWSGRLEKTQI